MYDYLEGSVTRRGAMECILDVGGVGYILLTPLGSEIPEAGSKALLFTHLSVREDSHTLFGFDSRELRDLFRELLKVKGVGPAMALGVLSGLSHSEFLNAILGEDLKALTAIKGVGKKTAEQILLDMRDRVPSLAKQTGGASGVLRPQPPPDTEDENVAAGVRALVHVGWSEKEALKRIRSVIEDVDPTDLNALVAAAFRGRN